MSYKRIGSIVPLMFEPERSEIDLYEYQYRIMRWNFNNSLVCSLNFIHAHRPLLAAWTCMPTPKTASLRIVFFSDIRRWRKIWQESGKTGHKALSRQHCTTSNMSADIGGLFSLVFRTDQCTGLAWWTSICLPCCSLLPPHHSCSLIGWWLRRLLQVTATRWVGIPLNLYGFQNFVPILSHHWKRFKGELQKSCGSRKPIGDLKESDSAEGCQFGTKQNGRSQPSSRN